MTKIAIYKFFGKQLYKKKRKLYLIFDNWSHLKDNHIKLAGCLDCCVYCQYVTFYNVSCTFTTCFLSCTGTQRTKGHKHNMWCPVMISFNLQTPYALSHFWMIVYHFSNVVWYYDNVCESLGQMSNNGFFAENVVKKIGKNNRRIVNLAFWRVLCPNETISAYAYGYSFLYENINV